MTEKTIHKLVTFTPALWEQVCNLQEKRGLITPAEAVRYCIADTFRREYPNYIRQPVPKMSIEEKAKREAEIDIMTKKIKADRPTEEGRAICNVLAGREEDGYCYWTTYELQSDGSDVTETERQPLIYVSQADIDNQFTTRAGDKITKEDYQAKKKELLKKNK